MRLLITTQAVDLDDPVLGFMHRWIVEFSKRCDTVHVICLKEGRHDLPKNVFVHSLGKETGRSRLKYISRFYRYAFSLRGEYDCVFVHMNSEYVVLGGLFWRMWEKKIVLWRNHKMRGLLTSVGVRLTNTICYTSPEAFVAQFAEAVRMPLGIDTEFFSPGALPPNSRSILFLGRLDAVKRVDVFVEALEKLHDQGVEFSADIVGDPTDPKSKYAHDVRNLAGPLALEGIVAMHPAVTNEKARDLFRLHSIYCNLTPSGSFDKTIGEAMASGAIVVCANAAVKDALPNKLLAGSGSADAATATLKTALELPETERRAISEASRAYVIREHSLSLLTDKLIIALSL
ncbi:MAG TPA: glycosyltransferase family 4 protein [Candidatus Paceibacterota bacterium]|jgi:glycosyltransferase involved in cell wall biosynthesis|nr:glycosyltransferase family 4 protein [Candidatus Paceibacterota bacterium]